MKSAIHGLGTLGRAIACVLAERSDLALAVVTDQDAALTGRAVGSILGQAEGAGPIVSDALGATEEPTILFHATTSHPATATGQILNALEKGYNVISAAEWLFHPWLRFEEETKAMDALARKKGLFVLGCGINPGFAFETLPVLLARTTDLVREVDILRVSNVGGVGPSDFAHLGFGLTLANFEAGVASGHIEGHMGFPESVAAVAEYLGIAIETISDRLEPTVAVAPIMLPYRTINSGEVAGITQVATGLRDGHDVIVMTLKMFLDPPSYGLRPMETVSIRGGRNFTVTIEPGAPPVAGAAAMMVHAARILSAGPARQGVLSLLDLPAGTPALAGTLRARTSIRSGAGVQITLG